MTWQLANSGQKIFPAIGKMYKENFIFMQSIEIANSIPTAALCRLY